ncbi:hypothetical protein FACS1894211_08700 [Clostridia bacterium]|nr:hypothetical protein FACS1894211_08700 [Clostridia bacterium]
MTAAKKRRTRIIALILACALIGAGLGGLIGWLAADKDNPSGGLGIIDPPAPPVRPPVAFTDKTFFENGATDYTVVVPADASGYVLFAAGELTGFLKTATGVDFSVTDDASAAYSATAKYLSVGNTSLLSSALPNVDTRTFGLSQYALKTEGESVFMAGGSDYGTLYAVYGFLNIIVDFEAYAEDEIYLTPKTESKLPDVDWNIKPSFDWRLGSRAPVWRQSTYQSRMRLQGMDDFLMSTFGSKNHNTFDLLPKEIYNDPAKPETYHPEFYSTDGEQLCYSNAGMRKELAERLKIAIEADPVSEIVMIGFQDVGSWCHCDACTAAHERYGTDAGVYIQACNEVADEIKAWLAAEHPERRPLTILLFAYYTTTTPPVTKGADGVYRPIDESVVMRDNTAIWFAPIYTDYTQSWNGVANYSIGEDFRGWSAVTNQIHVWNYAANFRNYFVPFNSFNTMQDNYKFALECSAVGFLDQAIYDSFSSGFEALRIWLESKLMWDVNESFNALVDAFFTQYYKDAAPGVRKYFDSLRSWYAYLENEKSISGAIFADLDKAEYWPKNKLDQWQGYLGEAYAAIEPLKTSDPLLYKTLFLRIQKESLSIRYLLIALYGNLYSQQTLLQMKLDFKADALTHKISHISESVLISDVYVRWGI